jgi:hypothetical protein
MKALLTGTLALLAGALAAHAQGAISLANYGTSVYLYVGYKPATGGPILLGGSTSGPAPTLSNYASETGNGNDWTVQLYAAVGANLPANALSQLTGVTATFANGVTDATSGTWFSSEIAVFPGYVPEVTVQLVAWYNDGGTITSLTQAVAVGVPTGESAIANVAPGYSGLYPQTGATLPLQALGNFDLVVSIPEPSTVALVITGASSFLMRRSPRGKK